MKERIGNNFPTFKKFFFPKPTRELRRYWWYRLWEVGSTIGYILFAAYLLLVFEEEIFLGLIIVAVVFLIALFVRATILYIIFGLADNKEK